MTDSRFVPLPNWIAKGNTAASPEQPTDATLNAAAEEYVYNPDTPMRQSGIRGETAVDPEEAFKAGARWQAMQAAAPTPNGEGVDLLTRELRDLAVALHRRHFAEVTQWKPLDYARGILSQIDNMTAGMSRIIDDQQATPINSEGLLDQLAQNTNLELSWGELKGDMSDCAWQVHRVNGGYNDREWTLVATGETPSIAIRAALEAVRDGDGR